MKDLAGKRFGQLVVIKLDGKIYRGKTLQRSCLNWLCICDCGNHSKVISEYLLNGNTKSCGCLAKCIIPPGTVIGRETVIRNDGGKANTFYMCKCLCSREYRRRGLRIHGKGCPSCAQRVWITTDISEGKWSSIRNSAIKRDKEFYIKPEEVQSLFEAQNKKCYFSGVPLVFVNTASVDRIDGQRGYTLDNIRIVHKYINMLRQNRQDDEFIKWCSLVASFSNNRPFPLSLI